jgi:hypothetical protein
MRKVFAVAFREYKAAVQTKAFIVSIVMMPMLMGLSIGVQLWIKKAEDAGTKKYAVIDRTGQLRSALEVAVVKHNKYEIIDTKTGERDGPEYQVEFIAPSDDSPEAVANQRFEMSQRVQKKDFSISGRKCSKFERPTPRRTIGTAFDSNPRRKWSAISRAGRPERSTTACSSSGSRTKACRRTSSDRFNRACR